MENPMTKLDNRPRVDPDPLARDPLIDDPVRRPVVRDRDSSYWLPALIGLAVVIGLVFWFSNWHRPLNTASNDTTTPQPITPPATQPAPAQPATKPPATQPPSTNP